MSERELFGGRRTPPPGYGFVHAHDSMRPFYCKRCGASVTASVISIHDDWHRALEVDLAHTDERVRALAQAFNDAHQGVHVALSPRIPL